MTAPLRHVELTVAGNEASDLLPVLSPALLEAHGARRGLWTVLDEGPVEACVALLVQGHDGSWAAHHQGFDAGREAGRTEDGEALAHRDGWVYVIGSHFGSKGGPLRPKRAFFARFREADAARGVVRLHVVRNQFRLHRAINDALVAADISPLPPGERVHQRFIRETQIRGAAKAKSWVDRLVIGDLPVNVEAAAFTPAGTLLLGLRFPVTQDGEPILVEISGVEGMFDSDPRSWPAVVRAYALTGVTPPGALTGFRALTATDTGFEAVVGSIDALGKGSVLLDDHPAGGDITCTHVRFSLGTGTRVDGSVVDDLAPFHNVEGLAVVDGERIYVTDEDHRIALWHD
ncbi:hypothetical protein [Asanoa sp. NPDC050611]|uniref:hypothetical protein n=1 Tax=Asanoa sp. NPDC050611 TaxID=3157098 RepID=UPI0033C676A3